MTKSRVWGAAGALLAGVLATAGCSASHNNVAGQGGGGDGGAAGHGSSSGSSGGGATATTSSSGGGGSGGLDFTVGSAGGGGAGNGCDDATKGSIYILGSNKEFARFEPQTETLTVLGDLACPGEDASSSTFSMAVDRQGVAWVLFVDGKIFHVDTKTVACTATAYSPCQDSFCQFGMGFVSNAADSEEETLYVSGVYNPSPGLGLAKIDTAALALTAIDDYDTLAGKGAELTGTGDAHLFGYFQDTPIHLAEIDKTNAHVLSTTDLLEVPSGTSWAFAFWGGSFYIMSGIAIRKYVPMTNITTIINPDVGFDIVGAGVSTCAPLEEPR
jgi:hypothetical protein